MKHAINIYTKLFDPTYFKDVEFYKSLYTTPIHEQALASTLSSNSELMSSSPQLLENNVLVLQEMYNFGLEFLIDAMRYPNKESKLSVGDLGLGLGLGVEAFDLADDNNDITSMMGSSGRVNPRSSSLVDMYEDDDIASMGVNNNRANKLPSAVAAIAIDEENDDTSDFSEIIPNVKHTPIPSTIFGSIDDSLRSELIVNILLIFKTWFQNISHANTFIRKAKETLGITFSSSDLLTKIFKQPPQLMTKLLQIIQWYLQDKFSFTDSTGYASILASVSLLFQIVRTLMKCLKESSNLTLVLSILEVDFAPELDKLLIASSSSRLPFNLMFKSRLEIYTIIGVLVKLSNWSSKITTSSSTVPDDDITTSEDTKTSIVHYISTVKIYNAADFHNQITYKVTPLLSMDYKFWYEYKPDILLDQLTSSLFVSWFTGNLIGSSEYASYNTSVDITSAANNISEFTIPGVDDEKVLDELQDIYTERDQKLNLHQKEEHSSISAATIEPEVNSKSLLPILLYLHAHFENSSFLFNLTSDYHPKNLNSLNFDSHIELLDILLSLSSYVFFYLHNSSVMKSSGKLFLDILLKLTSNQAIGGIDHDSTLVVADRVEDFEINEYKWKLCHHKEPVIPISSTSYGFKPSKLYILDTIQVFMRFNMTKKLDVPSFKMANSIIFQILSKEVNKGIHEYKWDSFYKTIFNVLLFIKKYKLEVLVNDDSTATSESTVSDANLVASIAPDGILELVEELLAILNLILFKFQDVISPEDSKPITYDLVYNLLLHQKRWNVL